MNWNTSFPEMVVVQQPEPRTFRSRFFRLLVFAVLGLVMTTFDACGGGSSSKGTTPPVVTYAISGTITRADNQQPLEGVAIQFSSGFASTSTDASGKWSKSGLSGTVTVTPVLAGWSFDQASRQTSVAASDVNFVATSVPIYSLSGTVTRSDNQDPLPGVAIQFSSGFASTSTDASGNWSKSDLSGTVTVTPVLAGWSFNPASSQLSDAASDVNFVATAVSTTAANVMFLHHSTGQNVWNGGVEAWFADYNSTHGTGYQVNQHWFGPGSNNPYDYWDRWIGNPVGVDTLESLVGTYNVIVWKHCFPVCNIGPDTGSASVSSYNQTQENYKLQYAALKEKMHSYPQIKFIVWTGAVQAVAGMSADEAARAKAFFDWVKNTWDESGDNIFIWDFYALETDNSSSLYMNPDYTTSDSHPNPEFCQVVAPYFSNRIVDVIEGRGDTGNLDGKP